MSIDTIIDLHIIYEDISAEESRIRRELIKSINEFLADPANKNRLHIWGDDELLGGRKGYACLLNVEVIGRTEDLWEVKIDDYIYRYTPYQMASIIKTTKEYECI